MTQRDLVETSTEPAAPTPVEALDYERALGGADASRMLVMGVSVAGGVLGLVWAMRFFVYTGLMLAAGRFQYIRFVDVLSIASWALGGAAGAGMIIAGVACAYHRRWGRLLMVYAAVVIGVLSILGGSSLFGNSPRAFGRMSRLGQVYFLFSTLSGLIESLILPALLVWLMTCAPARRFFDSLPTPGIRGFGERQSNK
jgi:hypothetical protein